MRNAKGRCLVCWSLVLGSVGTSLGFDPVNGDWSKSETDDIRVMTWNVLDTIRRTNDKLDIANNWNAVVRVIAAMQPDVLLIQEAGDNTTQGETGGVDSVSELTTVCELMMHGGFDPFESVNVTSYVQLYAPDYDLPYIFVSSVTDNFNRNVIMSRYPFLDLNGDSRDRYSDIPFISSDQYAPGGDGGVRGFQFVELDLPDSIYLGDLVVGGAHLKAGGSNSDEQQRREAAQNVAYLIDYWYNGAGTGAPDPNSRILDAPVATNILDENTAVILGGDWNEDEAINGQRGPALWLTAAAVTGGTDGTDRDRTDMIFDNSTDQFTGDTDTRGSRKLDYLAWQDSIATLRRSFIFNAQVIGSGNYPVPVDSFPGNPALVNVIASDHLPVLGDFVVPANRSGMVISEIMYNPNSSEAGPIDVEWVEVFNTSDETVDLNGWSLSDEDGATGTISGSALVVSGEAAVLIPDSQSVSDFQAAWGSGFPIFRLSNWSSMGLENDPSETNENLILRNFENIVEDSVNFDDEGDWPSDSPDGPSIYVLLGSLTIDGNDDGSNWARSVVGVDGAYANTLTSDFDGNDVGSPGIAPKCTVDADCTDGEFCSGMETCDGFTCIAGTFPCNGQLCDETGDVCVNCIIDDDCADSAFCNGVEVCTGGNCSPGADPCPGELCNEGLNACVQCFVDGACDNGSFCDGEEECDFGSCVSLGDPCLPFPCFDDTDDCGCLQNSDCDDGLFCNGEEQCGGDQRCTEGMRPCSDTEFCDEFADACVEGSRMILVAAGDDPAATTSGQDAIASATPGQPITIEIFLEDQADPMAGFEVALECSHVSSELTAPNLEYEPMSVLVDPARSDYVFFGQPGFPAIDQGQCDPSIACTTDMDCPAGNTMCDIGGSGTCTIAPPRAGAVLVGAPVTFAGEIRYLGEMVFDVPLDAEGEYVVRPICTPEDDCPSNLTLVRDGSFFPLPFTADGVVISVETGKCCVGETCIPDQTASECGVLGGTFAAGQTCDGPDPCACLIDCDCQDSDVCTYNECDNGTCLSMAVRYGDVAEPFTSPPIVQTSDILCGVAGFGNYCSCPNADIEGCGPSGVPISTGDILEIVAAFGGADPCGCGIPSAASANSHSLGPVFAMDDKATPQLSVQVRSASRRDRRVTVDLFVSDIETVIGYEASLVAMHPKAGMIQPSSVVVSERRRDYVFAGLTQTPLTDVEYGRAGAFAQASSTAVSAKRPAYIGSFTFDLPTGSARGWSFELGGTGAVFWNVSRERSYGALSAR